MCQLLSEFHVDELYSSDEIQESLGVGNAGGVRLSLSSDGMPRRLAVLTSHATVRQVSENPYHDRIEKDMLVYTGAGREGDQSIGGVNQRIPQQLTNLFPIYGFTLVTSRRDRAFGPKRWRFLGLLQYIRHYPDVQVDVRLEQRRVWIFELRIHSAPQNVLVSDDHEISSRVIMSARIAEPDDVTDREILSGPALPIVASEPDFATIESVRGRLLGVHPERFEHIVRAALERSGFRQVTVTQYSSDGGVDVNAVVGSELWPVRDMLVQIQAKRWLHTVGRREVAELRGSLRPFARGTVVTTSHYSRAAIAEAAEAGKNPIVLIDGFSFASLIHTLKVEI